MATDDIDMFEFGDEEGLTTEQEIDKALAASDNTKKSAKPRSGKTTGKSTGQVKRQQRVPMYQRQPLTVKNRNPDFEYRVVNDDPHRIERLKLAGWEVDTETMIGDSYAGQATSMGSATSKPVGGGKFGVVMRIPKEYYAEDQAAKQREVDRSEEAMLQSQADEINKAAGGKDEWRGEIKIGRGAPQS